MNNPFGKTALVAFGAAMVGSALTVAVFAALNASAYSSSGLAPAIVTPSQQGALYRVSQTTATPPTDFTEAAQSTINGVVSVKNFAKPQQQQYSYPFGYSDGEGYQGSGDPFLDFFFGQRPRQQQPRQRRRQQGQPQQEEQRGLGSGVIISDDGYIVTNAHVLEGADRIEVTLNDNATYTAKIIGSDDATDLALLKIDATGLHFLPVGDSDALRVGEWVLAVGNPFGLTSTVTTGIVSAKARSLGQEVDRYGRPKMKLESFIQTDAALNPGNSGGALVNTAGELVGINTAIFSPSGAYAGCSFAIPSAIVTKVVTDIKEYGEVQHARLGLSYQQLTPQLVKEKGITAANDGLYVGEVVDGQAAMEAGIKEGDVITALNGHATHTSAQLQGEMAKMRPGDKLRVDLLRDNKPLTLTATLRNTLGTTSVTKTQDAASALGCAFTPLTDKQRQQLGVRSGVQVHGLTDGLFSRAGVREGLIIIAINGQRVSKADDVEQLYDEIMNSDEPDKIMLIKGFYPTTGKRAYLAVPLVDEE